ncbi:MAG: amidohydrolase family protein [Planctomycetota bacterium]
MADRPEASDLREAHAHVYESELARSMLDLGLCASADDMLGMLRERAAAAAREQEIAGAGGRILAHSARPEGWQIPTWPTLAEIDTATAAAGPGTPCCVWCFDYHAMLCNSAALAIAGFDNSSADPTNGRLGRNERGDLTGLVYEAAAGIAWEAVMGDPRDAAALAQAGRDTLDGLLAFTVHGFGEVHDLKTRPWMPAALRAAAHGDALPAKLVLWPLVETLGDVFESREAWASKHGDMQLGGGKIFVDGTLNSRTAWMLHDYADVDAAAAHPRGMSIMSVDDIAAAINVADGYGLPIAAHAIGDGAVRAVLDALERAEPTARGHRIEHAELIDEADVPRIVRLRDEVGLKISVQPCHLLTDIEALERAVPGRLSRVLPLRELVDAGLEPGRDLMFGSDSPIVRPDPEDSVLAATTRGRLGDAGRIAPQQAITEAEAWACFARS